MLSIKDYELDKVKNPIIKKIGEGEYEKLKCNSPYHDFPNHLYIPPGTEKTHTCPACGHITTIRSTTTILECYRCLQMNCIDIDLHKSCQNILGEKC